MNRKLVSLYVLTVLLVFTFSTLLRVQKVEASGTIYIRTDGSIDPPTAPIQRNGDIYTLTGNITSDGDGIIVQKNDVTIDGAGYTVEGTNASQSMGIGLNGRSNVTIKNAEIKRFDGGVCLMNYSSGNIISGNNITANNYGGVYLYWGSGNSISDNNITNNGCGIRLEYSGFNNVSSNNIANNGDGVMICLNSCNNNVSGNNITNNERGVNFPDYSFDNPNRIYHNNFVDNANQVWSAGSGNVWDDGYPSGGNYWSEFSPGGADQKSGVNQDQPGSDGIVDSPYTINATNVDHYPLKTPIPEFPSFLILPLFMIATLLAVIAYKKRKEDH